MTKKIFKIIGIVCGSVAVFCGAVFGVMALMGKFKTPIIYPTTLSFEHTEITVVQGATFDPEKELSAQTEKPTIYEFKLVGFNPDFDRAVNQTECYVWFKNSEGPKLITLCDVNGNPLQTTSNKYLVHCNEPIYFMVNKIADDGIIDADSNTITNGVAILEARSTNDTLKKPDSPLRIYIDRKVEAVYVLDKDMHNKPNMGNTAFNTQDITIGTNMDLNFEYKVITQLSHRPIQAVNAKEIELYLDATGIEADYIPVTQEEIAKPDSPLYGLIRYENNKFILNDAKAGHYNFIVAVFPTYEAKTEYEASVEGEELEYPYVHRASAMLQTKLSVEIQEISISSLTFKRNSEALIHLYLYAQDDYISIDGPEDLIDNAKNNCLGAQLWLEDGLIEDVTRLDGFKFADYTNDNMWYGENYSIVFAPASRDAEFVGSSASCEIVNGTVELTNKHENDQKRTFTIYKSNLKLGENLTVISHLAEADDTKYYSTRSWAVLDETDAENPIIRLLRPGNYLNFYVKTTGVTEDNFIVATTDQFDYEANAVAGLYGKDKSWQVISKNTPELEEDENLVIGAFVVNGTFTNSLVGSVDKYFKYVGIQVDTQELEYEVKSLSNTLNVEFRGTQGEDDGVIYAEKSFEDIISITGGSYTAGVLLTTDNEKVHTVELTQGESSYNVVFVDGGNTYYIVGYLDGNGKFQNKVKLRGTWAKTDVLNLKMLMLHNAYNETAGKIIESLQIPNTNVDVELKNAQIVNNLTVEVKANYILNTNLMEVKVWKPTGTEDSNEYEKVNKDAGVYKFFENVSNNIIEVFSTNAKMLTMVKDFYGNTSAPVVNFNSGNIAVEIVGSVPDVCSADSWCYKITKLIGDGDEFVGTIDCGGVFTLPTIKVLSGKPGGLVFNTAGNEDRVKIDLFSSIDSAKNSNTYLQLDISYEAGYVYTYSLWVDGKKHDAELTEDTIFNEHISGPNDSGFQSKEDKQQTYAISYITHNGVLSITGNVVHVAKVGYEILEVNVAGTPGYIKVVVTTSNLLLEPESKSLYKNTEDSTTYLNELGVRIKYVDAQGESQYIKSSLANNVIIRDVSSVGYKVYADEERATFVIYQETDASNSDGYDSNDINYLSISNDEANGWIFARQETYINLKVKFTVETILGNVNCEVNFSSAVAVGINDVWSERNIYLDTYVVLGNKTPYSLLNFKDTTGNDGKFFYSIDNGDTKTVIELNENPTTINPTSVGVINILIYYGNILIRDDLMFSVLPNVIATPKKEQIDEKTEKDIKLTSGSHYGINDLFELKSYDTSKEYGSNEANLYNNVENLISLVDFSHLSIKGNDTEPTLTWDNESESLQVGDMQNMNGTKKVVTLQYMIAENEFVNVLSHEFVVEHKFTAEVTGYEDNVDKYYLYKVNKKYSPLKIKDKTPNQAEQNYKLVGVTHNAQNGEDPLTFSVTEGYFKLDANITQNRTINVTFVLQNPNYENDKLTYTTDITLAPYTPELRALGENDKAYSGAKYDVLNKLYDVADFNKDIITSLKVNRFLNELGTDITSQIVENFVPSGYVAGVSNPQCEVTFNDFAGDKLEVKVEFIVTYQDGSSYTYYAPLTINNKLSITIQYPEQNLGGDQQIAFIFDEKYAADARNLLNNSQKVTVANFEPILVYTNADISIDFANQDKAKNVVRAKVTNLLTKTDISDLKIEVIAYERGANGAAANKDSISTNGSVLTIDKLGVSQADFAAYYILKLSTSSTNYAYYFIRLYCANLNLSVYNNIDVVSYQTGNSDDVLKTSDTLAVVSVDSKIADVISSLNSSFSTVFKKEYNDATTTFWLYNGVETGGAYTNVENSTHQWAKLDGEATIQSLINDGTKFTTLTIGLMHTSMNAQYVYGTITIYVQPNNNISINDSRLKYEKPNGEFELELSNTTTQINSPIDNFKFINDEIYINGVKISDIQKQDINYGLLEIGENSLTLRKRVEEDTIICVKYCYGDTIAYVYYTYKATSLPNTQTTSTEVGTYNGSTFENQVNLTQGESENKYFNNYVGNYEVWAGSTLIYDSSNSKTASSVNGVNIQNDCITFTQTAQQWEIDLRFVYTDFADSAQFRTFRFVVKPCVSVGEISGITGGDGSSMNSPYTTIQNGDIYKQAEASKVTITKEITDGIAKFTIAGFEIRVNAAENDGKTEMDIIFNESDFVLGSNNGKFTNVMGDQPEKTIYFPHMATNKVITADIKILHRYYSGEDLDREVTYLTKRIYIEILKTYSNIAVKYLTDDSTHENVVAGEESVDLVEKFINKNNLLLYDAQGDILVDYNLANMGFATQGNPNKIEYSRGSFMDIANNALTFYRVDINELTRVYLNNNAGIIKNSVEYKFQIMKGNKIDGLDFTKNDDVQNTDGRLEDGYMSFMMGDPGEDEGFVKTFKLGKMLDEKNSTAFTLTDLAVNNVTINKPANKIIFVDGEAYQNDVKNSDGVFKDDQVFGEIFDAIQYRFEKEEGYVFYITLHINTNQVYLSVERLGGTAVASQTLEFSLGGVNGEATILNKFVVYLSVEKVEIKRDRPTSVYSYAIIDLNDVFIKTPVEANIIYEVAEGGTYLQAAQNKTIAAKADNILFSLNGSLLKFKAVGQDTEATLVFNVICVNNGKNYIIETVEYNITVKCNFTIIVNGGSWSENRFNDNLYTNFALKSNTVNAFVNGIEYTFEHSTQENELKDPNIDKYIKLAYDVYRLNDEISLNHQLVEMTISNVDGCELKNKNNEYYLLFTKDVNSTLDGEIVLTMIIDTDIGDYSVDWRINVTPIVEVRTNYTENYKIQNGSSYFKSNKPITLASPSGAALVIDDNNNLDIKIDAQYAVSIANGNIANKDLFEMTKENVNFVSGPTGAVITYGEDGEGNAKESYDGKGFITLPTVPVSLNGAQPYYVTYRVVVTYLGLVDGTADATANITADETATARVFYVTYMVANEQNVTTYTKPNGETLIHSANVDVTSAKVTNNNILTIMSYNNANTGSVKELFTTSFSGEDDNAKKQAFNDFVNILTGARITRVNSDGSSTIINFELTNSNGDVTINLSQGKGEDDKAVGILFNNELIGEFALMNGETKVVTIAPYSTQNQSGFRIYAGTNSLTPKSNYKLNDIIKNTSLIDIKSGSVNLNTIIVGIGTNPSVEWITNAKTVTSLDSEYATISVPAGTGAVYKYEIKAAKFSGSEEGSFYTTGETFYYIYGTDELYIVDYSSQGTAEDYFRVPYPTTGDKASINVANYVKKWHMDKNYALTSSVVDSSNITIQIEDLPGVTINDTIISCTTTFLQEYKNDNPYETEYCITVQLRVLGLSDTLQAIIKFKLPDTD